MKNKKDLSKLLLAGALTVFLIGIAAVVYFFVISDADSPPESETDTLETLVEVEEEPDPIQVIDVDGSPAGITLLSENTFLLTDPDHQVLWELEDKTAVIYAGQADMGGHVDGEALSGAFRRPWAAVPFLDGVAISDSQNNAIRLLRDGQLQTVNASPEDKEELNYPTGLAVSSDGSLYVADTHNGKIRRISSDGKMTTAAEGLQDPMGLSWQEDTLYIAETGADRIVSLKDGEISVVAGGEAGYTDGRIEEAAFSVPQAVAVDKDGAIYVADTGNSAVRRIRSGMVDTLLVREIGDENTSWPVSPTGLLLENEQLYICDNFAGKVLILQID